MSNRGLMITGGILLLIGVAVWTLVGFGKDESIEDRKENMNVEMEQTFRNNGRRQEIAEEMAEEGGAAQNAPAQ